MEFENVSLEDFTNFLARNLKNVKQRRFLLMQWHSCKIKQETAQRLSYIFESFITTVLYDPIVFHLLSDRIYLFFGTELPILFEWISSEDQHLLIRMMKFRKQLFRQRKESLNNQFDYSDIIFKENQIVDPIWRQQIIRDFVWMIIHKNQPYITTELIAAIQSIQIQKRGDIFLNNIHAGLQTKRHLHELLCIL